ncbi:hypothetical protein [Streptomyces sp. NPDC055060]
MAAGFRAPVDEERAVIAAPQRGHGPRGAERADGKSMMAEIHGRTTGACHGEGGSSRTAPRRGRHPRAPPAAGRPDSRTAGQPGGSDSRAVRTAGRFGQQDGSD